MYIDFTIDFTNKIMDLLYWDIIVSSFTPCKLVRYLNALKKTYLNMENFSMEIFANSLFLSTELRFNKSFILPSKREVFHKR